VTRIQKIVLAIAIVASAFEVAAIVGSVRMHYVDGAPGNGWARLTRALEQSGLGLPLTVISLCCVNIAIAFSKKKRDADA
jgi:hypothetical protein